uniref:Cytochrome P450 97B2 n=1 Tax=Aegilops tauschii TaxID=37682 RepID=M8B4L8_AEGTA
MATTAAAPPSGYFGSVQGRPTRLAPAASGRNSLLLRCSASGGDGAGGPDPILEEQKRRRAELSARSSSGEFTAPGTRWLAKLVPPGALAAGLLKAAGVGAARRGPELPQSFVIVSDPDIAKHILRDNSKAYSKGILAEILEFVMGTGLIPADGEFVTEMIGLFGKASGRLCEKLDKAAAEGEAVEMESLFSRLTLDVIGKAVFNYDFDSLSYDNGMVEAVYVTLREAEMRSTAPIPTWKIPIWKDVSPRQRKVNEALVLINNILDELISTCKRMVDEEDLQFHEEYMNEEDPSILRFLLASGEDVSSKQLRDDLMTMLIAGHETSAAVLTWTFYLLSKVDDVLGDGLPTIEDVKKLKYTTRVINESLRLYPQPPVLIRRSLEDDMLGEYPIGSYLPFGGGPRKCVGDMFATFENVVATAMLVKRFDFQMAPGAPPRRPTPGGADKSSVIHNEYVPISDLFESSTG